MRSNPHECTYLSAHNNTARAVRKKEIALKSIDRRTVRAYTTYIFKASSYSAGRTAIYQQRLYPRAARWNPNFIRTDEGDVTAANETEKTCLLWRECLLHDTTPRISLGRDYSHRWIKASQNAEDSVVARKKNHRDPGIEVTRTLRWQWWRNGRRGVWSIFYNGMEIEVDTQERDVARNTRGMHKFPNKFLRCTSLSRLARSPLSHAVSSRSRPFEKLLWHRVLFMSSWVPPWFLVGAGDGIMFSSSAVGIDGRKRARYWTRCYRQLWFLLYNFITVLGSSYDVWNLICVRVGGK